MPVAHAPFPILLAIPMLALAPHTHGEGAWMADFVGKYCIDCHDGGSRKGGLDLEKISSQPLTDHPEIWEHAIRRMDTRQMPPPEEDFRPDEKSYEATLGFLETTFDNAADRAPDPGETSPIRRMTRTEYGNAIRDLLHVEIDATELLPKDESSHGFDNITVTGLSPTLLNRYISAAQKIARVAAGGNGSPQARIVRVPADRTQEEHVEDLPPGTRGGIVFPHTFPATGDYEIDIRLTRDRDEKVEGLNGNHRIEVLVDGETEADFTVQPPKNPADHTQVDSHLKGRIHIGAGTRRIGVTFARNSSSLLETKREPYDAQFNVHRHPRQAPAVYQVSILGPFPGDREPAVNPLFGKIPDTDEARETHAAAVLKSLMDSAYRRPSTTQDLATAMEFYRTGAKQGGFAGGMEEAIAAILVSPNFLFKMELPPADAKKAGAYRLGDYELASRLSFFLWSSIPDRELLDAAKTGALSTPVGMEAQVRRMLADPKASSLSTNFANQWLQLRNLSTVSPDLRMFPDFDDNLREAFRTETELLFRDVVSEDRSVTDLLDPGFTYLNGRLAKHYGIPHIQGSRFRKILLPPASKRGGLLRQGSILTVTSYANRTSPVIRGHWVLENILGTPTPPPPADVPSLDDVIVSGSLPMRERLAKHRADKACASCHNLMDPPGFALENYDAVGRWREKEGSSPIDASGGLPDGQEFIGIDGIAQALQERPDIFARTITEKLLTYALGRGVDHRDAPAVRRILRKAEPSGYRFSEIVLGIAESVPFTLRKDHVSDQ